jgi:predicted nucleotidyltransferase
MTYLDLVLGLADAGVRFIVCGGVAVVWHGSSRVTDDLDILYEPGRENTKRLARRLAAWHAYPRGMEPGLPWTADERTLRQATMYTLTTDAGSLDIFREMAGVGSWDQAIRRSVMLSLEGRQVHALGIAQLLAAKRQAGRPKDLEDILTLEALAQLKRGGAG